MIENILQQLDDKDRQKLMVAFKGGFSQIIFYKDNHFIGVNIESTNRLIILKQVGD